MAFARDLVKFSRLYSLNDFTKLSNSGSFNNFPFIMSVRTAKHYNPKFKWFRGKKVIDVILPHTERYQEMQKYMLNNLKLYPRYWKRRPLTITSANEIIDPYKPESGDGKVSKLSAKGILQKVKTDSKSYISEKTALRKIKNYDHNFSVPTFQQEAHDIYVKAHTTLMKMDPDELSKYATESAVEQMMRGLELKTIRWQFLESLEPPKLVQSRCQDILVEKNCFAQLTVRFHTKQILAIYDRFGRLMYGSEIVPKDVLEYVVFEKHINNEYGEWRLLGKIIPEYKDSTTYTRTYRVEKEEEEEEVEEEDYNEFLAKIGKEENYVSPNENVEYKNTLELARSLYKPEK